MLRLMLYNICQGGGENLPLISSIVKKSNPDILGLLETVGWGTDKLQSFARATNLHYSFLGKANTKYDMALLATQAPLEVVNIQEGFWHAVIRSVYRLSSVGDLAVFLVHLNPRDADARLEEVRRLLDLARSCRQVVLLGDFNSLSPHDLYDHSELLSLFHAHNLTKFGIDKIRFDCIEELEESSFIDAARAVSAPYVSTVPTPANQDSAHLAPLRLDYIFISSSLKPFIYSYNVVRDTPTDQASDHYPVMVDIVIDLSD